MLIKNKNFMKMLIHYSLFYAIYTCTGAIINNLVEPYHFGSKSSSLFGGSFILAGVISSFYVSSSVDKNK